MNRKPRREKYIKKFPKNNSNSSSNEEEEFNEIKITIEIPPVEVKIPPVQIPDVKVDISHLESKESKNEASYVNKFWSNKIWKHALWNNPLFRFLSTVIISIGAVLVTSYFNDKQWKEQHTTTSQEKFIDDAYAAIRDFSEKSSIRMNDQRSFLIMRLSNYKASLLETAKFEANHLKLPQERLNRIRDSVYNNLRIHHPDYYIDHSIIETHNAAYYASISYLSKFLPDSLNRKLHEFDAMINPEDEQTNLIFMAYESEFREPLSTVDPVRIASMFMDSVAVDHGKLVTQLYQSIAHNKLGAKQNKGDAQ